VGATGLGRLWALEWAWHIRVTNLRCLKATESKSEIPNLKSNFSIFDTEISTFIFTIFFGVTGFCGLWAFASQGKLFIQAVTVGATAFRGLWALEWA